MKTPISYYGGKQLMADRIIDMMPAHRIYVEPFFGGGAVFFRKPPVGLEVINDKNDRLINFYMQLRDQFPELQKRIQSTVCSESMFRYAKDVHNKRVESSDLEKAWAIWIITNGSFGGSMHGGWKWDNGTGGSHTGIKLGNGRETFSKLIHERLRHTQISCKDALRVITDRDSVDTFFYLDPPYPGHVQGHYFGYTHRDFYELLQVLGSIKGKFILSNFWNQTLRYHVAVNNWYVSAIDMPMKVNQKKGQNTNKKSEILIYNFQIPNTLFYHADQSNH